ncbi:hypothetical protein N7537_007209 [Penicillium hordei]|uniref:Uncharacterized protein n=1 Tax=Penicillium hordei TaxID=40994 RepID=A0AAD6H3T6_9EURO|nr:uncharacterized protein N7537_007209 [Penicillium hordei]KAJ5604253.1 hypothetical protein N7537_007209 [Penicillium hordei]
MKSPPQPATVHEPDRYLYRMASATRDRVTKRNSTLYSLNGARYKSEKAPDYIRGESTRSGSLNEIDIDSERNEVPGCRFRKVSFSDPKIYVEQRVYEGVTDRTIIYELAFSGRIELDKEYKFLAYGDEDKILGKRDLILRIVSGHTKYYGYDIKDNIYIDEESISKESPYTENREMIDDLSSKDIELLRLRFVGHGHPAEDNLGVGDLVIFVIYKP